LSAKTRGEDLVENVRRIADTLVELKQKGLPRQILIIWVQKKTRLPQKDIIAVFDALANINKEFTAPTA
jgi:hypothetical protein